MRGDYHSLDFVCSFVDGCYLGVSVCSFHFHTLEIAVAAENLKSVIYYFKSDVGGVLLSHCSFHSIRHVLLLKLCCAVNKKSCTSQLGGHIRQLESDSLLLANRLAELDSFL